LIVTLEPVWADWEVDKKEQIGPRWPVVRPVLAALERHGIIMSDVTPNNVRFAEEVAEL
jgi:hypothetical protein